MARPLTPAERTELGPRCYALSLEGHSNRSIAEALDIHRATVARLISLEAKERKKELFKEHTAIHLLDRTRRTQQEAYRRLDAIRQDSASPAVSGLIHGLVSALKLEAELTGSLAPAKRLSVVQHVGRGPDLEVLSEEELDVLHGLLTKATGGQLDIEDEDALYNRVIEAGDGG